MNDNASKWIAALRSGEYAQAHHRLRRDDRYCCLGVACDLFHQSGGDGEWVTHRGPGGVVMYSFETPRNRRESARARIAKLPAEVRVWLGLASDVGGYGVEGECLARLNDSGGRSLAEIADIIDSEPDGLFDRTGA